MSNLFGQEKPQCPQCLLVYYFHYIQHNETDCVPLKRVKICFLFRLGGKPIWFTTLTYHIQPSNNNDDGEVKTQLK